MSLATMRSEPGKMYAPQSPQNGEAPQVASVNVS